MNQDQPQASTQTISVYFAKKEKPQQVADAAAPVKEKRRQRSGSRSNRHIHSSVSSRPRRRRSSVSSSSNQRPKRERVDVSLDLNMSVFQMEPSHRIRAASLLLKEEVFDVTENDIQAIVLGDKALSGYFCVFQLELDQAVAAEEAFDELNELHKLKDLDLLPGTFCWYESACGRHFLNVVLPYNNMISNQTKALNKSCKIVRDVALDTVGVLGNKLIRGEYFASGGFGKMGESRWWRLEKFTIAAFMSEEESAEDAKTKVLNQRQLQAMGNFRRSLKDAKKLEELNAFNAFWRDYGLTLFDNDRLKSANDFGFKSFLSLNNRLDKVANLCGKAFTKKHALSKLTGADLAFYKKLSQVFGADLLSRHGLDWFGLGDRDALDSYCDTFLSLSVKNPESYHDVLYSLLGDEAISLVALELLQGFASSSVGRKKSKNIEDFESTYNKPVSAKPMLDAVRKLAEAGVPRSCHMIVLKYQANKSSDDRLASYTKLVEKIDQKKLANQSIDDAMLGLSASLSDQSFNLSTLGSKDLDQLATIVGEQADGEMSIAEVGQSFVRLKNVAEARKGGLLAMTVLAKEQNAESNDQDPAVLDAVSGDDMLDQNQIEITLDNNVSESLSVNQHSSSGNEEEQKNEEDEDNADEDDAKASDSRDNIKTLADFISFHPAFVVSEFDPNSVEDVYCLYQVFDQGRYGGAGSLGAVNNGGSEEYINVVKTKDMLSRVGLGESATAEEYYQKLKSEEATSAFHDWVLEEATGNNAEVDWQVRFNHFQSYKTAYVEANEKLSFTQFLAESDYDLAEREIIRGVARDRLTCDQDDDVEVAVDLFDGWMGTRKSFKAFVDLNEKVIDERLSSSRARFVPVVEQVCADLSFQELIDNQPALQVFNIDNAADLHALYQVYINHETSDQAGVAGHHNGIFDAALVSLPDEFDRQIEVDTYYGQLKATQYGEGFSAWLLESVDQNQRGVDWDVRRENFIFQKSALGNQISVDEFIKVKGLDDEAASSFRAADVDNQSRMNFSAWDSQYEQCCNSEKAQGDPAADEEKREEQRRGHGRRILVPGLDGQSDVSISTSIDSETFMQWVPRGHGAAESFEDERAPEKTCWGIVCAFFRAYAWDTYWVVAAPDSQAANEHAQAGQLAKAYEATRISQADDFASEVVEDDDDDHSRSAASVESANMPFGDASLVVDTRDRSDVGSARSRSRSRRSSTASATTPARVMGSPRHTNGNRYIDLEAGDDVDAPRVLIWRPTGVPSTCDDVMIIALGFLISDAASQAVIDIPQTYFSDQQAHDFYMSLPEFTRGLYTVFISIESFLVQIADLAVGNSIWSQVLFGAALAKWLYKMGSSWYENRQLTKAGADSSDKELPNIWDAATFGALVLARITAEQVNEAGIDLDVVYHGVCSGASQTGDNPAIYNQFLCMLRVVLEQLGEVALDTFMSKGALAFYSVVLFYQFVVRDAYGVWQQKNRFQEMIEAAQGLAESAQSCMMSAWLYVKAAFWKTHDVRPAENGQDLAVLDEVPLTPLLSRLPIMRQTIWRFTGLPRICDYGMLTSASVLTLSALLKVRSLPGVAARFFSATMQQHNFYNDLPSVTKALYSAVVNAQEFMVRIADSSLAHSGWSKLLFFSALFKLLVKAASGVYQYYQMGKVGAGLADLELPSIWVAASFALLYALKTAAQSVNSSGISLQLAFDGVCKDVGPSGINPAYYNRFLCMLETVGSQLTDVLSDTFVSTPAFITYGIIVLYQFIGRDTLSMVQQYHRFEALESSGELALFEVADSDNEDFDDIIGKTNPL